MINIVKIFSHAVDASSRRVGKFLRFGKNDVQTSPLAAPFGIDGHPPDNIRAIYAKTSDKGKTILLGYLNVDQSAEKGATRLYSTDADGNLAFEIFLRPDGTAELGGSIDNLMRFAATNTQLQSLVTQLQTELGKIAVGITAAGGAYTPGILSLDLSSAKINELKTS